MSRDQIFTENPGATHREKTLQAVERELARLRPVRVSIWDRRMVLAGSFSMAVMGFLTLWRTGGLKLRESGPSAGPVTGVAAGPLAPTAVQEGEALNQALNLNIELLDNLDLMDNLDLLSDFDVLMQWDGKDV